MEAIAISCKGSVSELSGAVRSVVAADIRFFRVEGAVMPEYSSTSTSSGWVTTRRSGSASVDHWRWQ
jgi:hypothetical protein